MSSIQWWRSWHGAPTDHKWSVVAMNAKVKTGVVAAIAWALMDYASQNKDRGSINGFDVETYSVFSGFKQSQIEAVMAAMIEKEMIVDGKFSNWEKRQPKREDDSRDRLRNWRDKKRNETQSNTDDVDVTRQIKIKDKDKDKDKELKEEEEEEEEEKSAAAATSYDDLSELNVWTGVTGMIAYPSKARDEAPYIIRSLVAQHGNKTIDYCKPYYQEWISRGYSKTNHGWLDWALAGQQPKNGKTKFTRYAKVDQPSPDEIAKALKGE